MRQIRYYSLSKATGQPVWRHSGLTTFAKYKKARHIKGGRALKHARKRFQEYKNYKIQHGFKSVNGYWEIK